MRRDWVILLTVTFVALISFSACSQDETEDRSKVPGPHTRFAELDQFHPIMGKIVFVTKKIYGGDLKYNCILRGKVRNVTQRAFRDVYIVWALYDKEESLFPVYMDDQYMNSIFLDKIDYLDSKSEVDFTINLDLYGTVDIESAEKIRDAVLNGREEAGIYIVQRK